MWPKNTEKKHLLSPLPVEIALRQKSRMLTPLLNKLSYDGVVAEMCGLWVSLDHTKSGLPVALSKYACKDTEKSNVKYLINFYSDFTKSIVKILNLIK